jgi:hypothetical protein
MRRQESIATPAPERQGRTGRRSEDVGAVEVRRVVQHLISRPLAHPDIGKIAVMVINDYGDDLMKVFAL